MPPEAAPTGRPGHSRRGWQTKPGDLDLESLPALLGLLVPDSEGAAALGRPAGLDRLRAVLRVQLVHRCGPARAGVGLWSLRARGRG